MSGQKETTPKPFKLKPANTAMSIEELLTLLDGTHLENMPKAATAGFGLPVLFGRWTTKKRLGKLKQDIQNFILIRLIPHNMVTQKLVSLNWIDSYTLEIVIRWPSFLWQLIGTVEERIQNEDTPKEFRFPENHDVFHSILLYCDERAETSEQNEKAILFDKF